MQHRIRLTLAFLLFGAACGAAPRTGGSRGGSGGEGGSGGKSSTGGSGGESSSGGSGGESSTGGKGGSGGAGSGGGGTGGSLGGDGGSVGTGGGGSPDAATPGPDGGAATGGSSGGGCGTAKFCDDFEAQMPGQAPTGMFKVDTAGGGSITVDGNKGFSGKQSIVLKKAGGYPGTWLTFSNVAAQIPSNDLHGRAMIWMTQVPGAAHWDGIMASGSKAGGGNATYILGGMYKNFMAVYHPGDCSTDSKTPFPVGRWACIQWEFMGSKDGKHLHRMLLDGQVVDNGVQDGKQGVCAAGGGTHDWTAPTFNTLKVGYVAYGGGSGDIWIDDLAWGEQPIPCPPPK
jgi:hypothetical protein